MYQTKGIIIKKEDRGENDKLITLFSADHGKIRLLAKSARKNTSKLASQLELFSLVDVGFVLGRANNVLTSALERENFTLLKKDLKKLAATEHIAGIVYKYTFFDEKDEGIFDILERSFHYISSQDLGDVELDYFLRYFEYRFLTLLGYKPEEDKVSRFFENKGIISKRELEDIKLILKRYFKNIFNEV